MCTSRGILAGKGVQERQSRRSRQEDEVLESSHEFGSRLQQRTERLHILIKQREQNRNRLPGWHLGTSTNF